MAYATLDDITDIYGDRALYVADHDGTGIVNTAAVDRALTSASDEIDTYLGTRYTLPLAEVPGFLRQLCVDIALYRLALSADVLSEEHRRRYEDARSALQRLADGRAALVFTQSGSEDPAAPDAASGPRPVVVGGPPRLFSRDMMRDL